jgi:hypothetical protein
MESESELVFPESVAQNLSILISPVLAEFIDYAAPGKDHESVLEQIDIEKQSELSVMSVQTEARELDLSGIV